MKSAWKGLVIGALTGMLGGAAMDAAAAGRRKATEVAGNLAEKAGHTVDAAPGMAKAAGRKAVATLHDADLPDKVRQVASKIETSGAAEKIKDAVGT